MTTISSTRTTTATMTSPLGRAYSLACTLLVFCLAWAAVVARPFGAQAAKDPRLAALSAREQRLRAESVAVQRVVDRRWATYRAQLRQRNSQIADARQAQLAAAAAAPSVSVVSAAPATSSGSS